MLSRQVGAVRYSMRHGLRVAEFSEAARALLVAQQAKQSATVYDADDPHGGRKLRKSKREGVFADWLVNRFALGRGSAVLDVAGGAGRLAKALVQHGVGRVVVVDPRPPKAPPDGYSHDVVPFDDAYVWRGEMPVTLVAALHPDQATDAALRWARRHAVPFAIVPCCVFPDLFPYRRWLDRPVTTYEQLVAYLYAECGEGEVAKAFLPIQGRNIVLHSL